MLSESNQDFISGQRKRFTSLQFTGSSVLRRHFRKQRIADILEKSRLSAGSFAAGFDVGSRNAGFRSNEIGASMGWILKLGGDPFKVFVWLSSYCYTAAYLYRRNCTSVFQKERRRRKTLTRATRSFSRSRYVPTGDATRTFGRGLCRTQEGIKAMAAKYSECKLLRRPNTFNSNSLLLLDVILFRKMTSLTNRKPDLRRVSGENFVCNGNLGLAL
ncbi:hypothetical protein CDAR_502191 [Caerostris darwini]|uniref:Uncharacterized protein n=1 Tax=Caerostris darwini TaxID=1538125 RepID=A0AAV4SEF2_9ARAC|nr:hypothetical protein CDAR_502191 [Caerostris darwini]